MTQFTISNELRIWWSLIDKSWLSFIFVFSSSHSLNFSIVAWPSDSALSDSRLLQNPINFSEFFVGIVSLCRHVVCLRSSNGVRGLLNVCSLWYRDLLIVGIADGLLIVGIANGLLLCLYLYLLCLKATIWEILGIFFFQVDNFSE